MNIDFSELNNHMELFDTLLGPEQSKNREIRYDYDLGRDSRPESLKSGMEFFRVQITTRNSNHNPMRMNWFYHSDPQAEKWYISSLSLRALGISFINSKIIQSLSTLEYLDLQGNNLPDFELSDLSGLLKLHTINISSNKLTQINIEDLKDIPNLRYLSFFNNKINKFDFEIIMKFSNLNRVNFSNNLLTSADLSLIGSLRYLQSIHLSSNKITEFTFNNLYNKNLLNLLMNDNLISTIEMGNSHLPELNLITFADNNLTQFNLQDLLKIAPKLKVIHLWGNRISNISWKNVGDNELEDIDLNSNPISNCIISGNFMKLIEFNIAYNKLKRLDLSKTNFKLIEKINLSFNPIDELILPELNSLSELKLIDLIGTNIKKLEIPYRGTNVINMDSVGKIGSYEYEIWKYDGIKLQVPKSTDINIIN